MYFKKSDISLISFFFIFVFALLFFILSFPDSAFAGLGEDLIARESWRKISLDLQGASLINVLKVFSQQSGLNFIASQNVADKPITLYLENVPIREALEKILNSYNLTYLLDEGSNIFVVKELIRPEVETITKIYPLKYARVNSSPLNTAGARSTAGSSLVEVVTALLSSYGKLNEDSRTNSLVITDLPLQFQLIEETIKKLDIPVPQVVIEAEIIDTTKQLVDTLGMKWSSSLYTLGLASRSGFAVPFGKLWDTSTVTTGAINSVGTAATLQLLITDKKTKVLARPRILTLSNETAEIKITGITAVGTTTTNTSIGTATAQSVSGVERYEVGITLKVTPSVNATTGEVTMVLEPEVSGVETSNISGFFDPQKRSAKVTVAVKDGETVVIGGLVRKDFNDTRKKLPILGDIPFAGTLFRHKDLDDKDRELLVFITPHIIKEGSVDLAKTTEEAYNKEIIVQREQSDSKNRKEAIDKALSIWDNK